MKSHLYILVILSLFLLNISAPAQQFPDSSLVRPGEVDFISPFEQQVFSDLLENEQLCWIDLFLCNDSLVTQAKANEYETVFKGTAGRFKTDYYQKYALCPGSHQ
jgi:hypothetical protein